MSDAENLLHQNELAKAYDPSAIEEKWAAYWVAERLFDTPAPTADDHRKSFTMLLPPPNVTGRLHMGHMLNQAEMDILTRWHRMRGDRALWVPGTDHAGIATQMMVERQLAAEGKTTREQLGREKFTERVWEWKRQYGGAITDQMRRLGASVDWAREYFTMDAGLSTAVIEAFVRLYEQGLVYRGAYIVNWDPQAQTAVSDLEVETEERIGKLYSIRYPLADGSGSLVIATTRPETLLGDVAVAVNPSDPRYTEMIGKKLALPLTGREIPVVADDWANPEFGTGAVKVTPAHDPNDFAIGQRHGLPSLSILDKKARMDLPAAATGDNDEGRAARAAYQGLDRFTARKLVLEHLEAAGLLVEVKDHAMAVPVSQRTGSVIEPRLSDQWFIKIQPLADKAIAAVEQGHIRFTPEMYAKTYFEWMANIHDWCISRQLWWGHRIPAWHCGACAGITVARSAPAACAQCGSAELTQETDVLDTWFSSGLLPFTVFGWPQVQGSGVRAQGSEVQTAGGLSPEPWTLTPDLQAFYPTDLLVTGFDILFFWVARMIMLGTHFMLDVPMPDGTARTLADAVPFREVYIHALVRDANREKMSKTKGNVIDPIDIIGRFGTDAVRFTLASMASPGTDIAFSEKRTEGYRAFANKIWNAARFLLMQFERGAGLGFFANATEHPYLATTLPAGTPLETRWIFSRLNVVSAEVEKGLAQYRFDEAANALYQFFWGEFCDWYLELIKLRLDVPEEKQTELPYLVTMGSLLIVFDAALRLLSPFMPFITEELWHALPLMKAYRERAGEVKSIALTSYPVAADFPADPAAESAMATLQELIVTVRAIRKEMAVPEKEAAPIALYSTSAAVVALARENADMLARMARVSSVEIAPVPLTGPGARSTAEFDVQVVYERQIDVAAERERLVKDIAKYEKGLASAERQLGNEAFMGKAPAHIVEGLKKQAAETRLLLEKASKALAELPPA
jgi:valyl-tRNA synthetase